MDGCKYCRMNEDGDCPDDRKSLFDFEICRLTCSEIGKELHVDGTIYNNRLCVYLGGIYSLFSGEKKIKYCPMCGRKLKEEE